MMLICSHSKSDFTYLQFMCLNSSFINITSIWFAINLLKSENCKNEKTETWSLLIVICIALWYTICFIIDLARCLFWTLVIMICILFIASFFIEYNKESFFEIQRFSSFESHLLIMILFISAMSLLSFSILSYLMFIAFYSFFSLVIFK